MPRRGYKKRNTQKDPIHSSYEVAKLINYTMKDGKKTVAQRAVYNSLSMIRDKKLDPLEVLQGAISNVSPTKEVKPRRVGGASYLVPMDTRPARRIFLALNWIIESANKRPNKQYHTFSDKLFSELMDAYQNQGEAVNKKIQVEKLALANKAFAHFNW
ncbi:30S ribosomal protein S7 [Candidatus Roizmanbacteria bacterium RIFCSPLOWO2_12_FULL_37_7b]|nr:MAG: 30S ribosomal protein S7 [Candidatus Roizmanbacteria bacterium RIFCSPHIGHO2_12_FULL_37_23]OGK61252.1 MAG: 30S ribosomal protein S7 [Candidatus Roizmanbacteria bacterium RIFCSPLOWO2_12_FULL_37_7b]